MSHQVLALWTGETEPSRVYHLKPFSVMTRGPDENGVRTTLYVQCPQSRAPFMATATPPVKLIETVSLGLPVSKYGAGLASLGML